ncbi:MAG: type VI secretion system-associated protein TagF [Rhodocyclaceae bacterium]|nr:type VI secretion system-associated protein TagF [Pseudomonadota bacterium]MDQ7972487.1 type VI secretion system-associated protein TagF [Rhodocyclaceae bacterium]MDQ8000771.1 type VI secretion system-associated protein TagF [Pseudomonadota bacterium]MDQ8016849.1 type VI secretion system-associated protein TagF [Pseudomonadota bacterium]
MSAPQVQMQRPSYFGKLPSRGDFVKGQYNPQLLKALDEWLSQAMALLAEDPRWKLIYDAAPPLHFACLGSRSRLAIAGHLRPSHDEASRRYPFLAAVPIEAEAALDFLVGAPALLGDCWQHLAGTVAQLAASTEPDAPLRGLENWSPAIPSAFRGSVQAASYDAFLQGYSLLRVEQMLAFAGHRVSLRRAILALGMLLQPVMGSSVPHLEKGLTLPLPSDPACRELVATFWLDLVSQFFARADLELLVCIGDVHGRPRLVIGFNGLSPRSLQGVIHPQVYAEQNIEVDNAEWVEESIHSNYALYKLVSYLDQPQLPLAIVLGTFREVFIGE